MERPATQFAESADGVTIAYSAFGNGPTVVELPQSGWSHLHLWDVPRIGAFYQMLAERCRVVTYDCRGLGLSQRGAFRYDFDSHSADLEAVLEAAGCEPTTILAGVHLGPFAVEYAAREPERVKKLVLFDTFLDGARYGATTPMAEVRELMPVQPELFLRMVLIAGARIPEADVELMEAALGPLNQAEPLADLVNAAIAGDARAIARECRTPALVIRHRQLRNIAEDVTREVAETLPQANLVLLEGQSHYIEYGPPEETVRLIAEWASVDAGCSAAAGPASPDEIGLTMREREVLSHLAAGQPNGEIAAALVISRATVARHVSNVLGKTGLSNRTELALYAREHGLEVRP